MLFIVRILQKFIHLVATTYKELFRTLFYITREAFYSEYIEEDVEEYCKIFLSSCYQTKKDAAKSIKYICFL